MVCLECGRMIELGTKFCPHCGKATPLNNVALVMDVPNPLFAKFKNAFVACNAAEIKSLDITLFAKSWKAALTDVI